LSLIAQECELAVAREFSATAGLTLAIAPPGRPSKSVTGQSIYHLVQLGECTKVWLVNCLRLLVLYKKSASKRYLGIDLRPTTNL
jgi:hypothetical protein